MVLSPLSPASAAAKVSAAITLDLPPAMVLARLRELYPGRNRIALVRGPALAAASAAEIQQQAQKLGYDLQIVDCAGPRDLLDSVGRVRGRVDFVWTLPDSRLYTGPVVSALILAGIRNGIPVVGFSIGMVQSGALLGFYSDYRDIGVQTGEMALLKLGDQRVRPREGPRKLNSAVNERVMRVLGAPYAAAGAKGLIIVK
jgi:ABC-type uncharacterized transport system substrate-binding protein